MPAAKQTKALLYSLATRSPPQSSSPNEDSEPNSKHRRRKGAWLSPITCNCPCLFFAGLGLAVLFLISIAIPLTVALTRSAAKISSTSITTESITATSVTTTSATSVTTTSATTSTASTTSTTTVSSTSSTSTTSSTASETTSTTVTTSTASTSSTTSVTSTSSTTTTETTSTATTSTTETTTTATSTTSSTATTSTATTSTTTACLSSNTGNLATINGGAGIAWTQFADSYVATITQPYLSFGFENDNHRQWYLDGVSAVDTVAPSSQLLDNPSFENSSTSIPGWTIQQGCCISNAANINTTGCISGTNCLNYYCGPENTVSSLGQYFNAIVGHTYNISYYLKTAGTGAQPTVCAVSIY